VHINPEHVNLWGQRFSDAGATRINS
jgi:hypothetical protein